MHSQACSILLATDVHVTEFLTTLVGTMSGQTVATYSSAVCRTYELGLSRNFADSALVSSVIKAARSACPSEPKYDTNYCFAMMDKHLGSLATPARMTESTLLGKTIHLLQRYSWGRTGELRSLNRDHIKLLAGSSSRSTQVETFDKADCIELTLRGTKNGKGLNKTSSIIRISNIRQKVVGHRAYTTLNLFACMAELERRYNGRRIANREAPNNSAAYQKEQNRFGNGFFLSLEPESQSGQYYYLSTGRIRNYGLSAMRAAGIPDKYTCHATRHAAESLLLDAGVAERDVARQARHNKGVMQSTYHHPSDFDHTQRAKALREHVSDVNPQELLACALTPLPRSQRHFTPLRDAGEPTS